MAEVRFYHLLSKSVEEAVPQLVSKTQERGWRSIIKATEPFMLEGISKGLWGMSQTSFLAHGIDGADDGFAKKQPVWLTTDDKNPNGAKVLFLIEGADHADIASFDMICAVFDGQNPTSVAIAREQWKHYKNEGLELTYWQQTPQGWQKKA